METEARNYRATGGVYLIEMAFGLSMTAVGAVMPAIASTYGTSLAALGLVSSARSVGGLLVVLSAGILADAVGKPQVLLAGGVLMAITLWASGLAASYLFLLGSFLLLGLGSGLVDTITNAFIADAHPAKQGTFLGLLHAIFGIGAFLGPIYAAFLLDLGASWRVAFAWLGLGTLLATVCFFWSLGGASGLRGWRRSSGAVSEGALALGRVWRWRSTGLASLGMLAYAGSQSNFVYWLVMYFRNVLGAGPIQASSSLSLFWLGIILGRFITTWLSGMLDVRRILFASCGVGAVINLVALLPMPVSWALPAVFAVGATTGGTIPLLMAYGSKCYPERSGTISGVLLTSLQIGMMIFPWLVGVIAEAAGLRFGLATCVLLLAAAALSFYGLEPAGAGSETRRE